MGAIKWHKNILQLGDKEVVFDDNIDEVIECAEVILVITDWQTENNENLYGILKEPGKRWRIQSISEIKSEPYFSVYIRV